MLADARLNNARDQALVKNTAQAVYKNLTKLFREELRMETASLSSCLGRFQPISRDTLRRPPACRTRHGDRFCGRCQCVYHGHLVDG